MVKYVRTGSRKGRVEIYLAEVPNKGVISSLTCPARGSSPTQPDVLDLMSEALRCLVARLGILIALKLAQNVPFVKVAYYCLKIGVKASHGRGKHGEDI